MLLVRTGVVSLESASAAKCLVRAPRDPDQ
jgi:hypothetical protein